MLCCSGYLMRFFERVSPGGIREWRENDGQVAATEEDDDSSNSVVLVNSNRILVYYNNIYPRRFGKGVVWYSRERFLLQSHGA
ncbi:hypothetical protein FCV25MIE_31231 [Fagus crenata]